MQQSQWGHYLQSLYLASLNTPKAIAQKPSFWIVYPKNDLPFGGEGIPVLPIP